jgi:uncharacterized protein (DUF779 family)
MSERVVATEAANDLIDRVRSDHGPLMFHQSGGCCDGSAPMCFPRGDFRVGKGDLLLGEIHGCEFYMARDQYAYMEGSQLVIDVVKGRGSSFSLEIPYGLRFLTRSRRFGADEIDSLCSID